MTAKAKAKERARKQVENAAGLGLLLGAFGGMMLAHEVHEAAAVGRAMTAAGRKATLELAVRAVIDAWRLERARWTNCPSQLATALNDLEQALGRT